MHDSAAATVQPTSRSRRRRPLRAFGRRRCRPTDRGPPGARGPRASRATSASARLGAVGGQVQLDLSKHGQNRRRDRHGRGRPRRIDRLHERIHFGLGAARDLQHAAEQAGAADCAGASRSRMTASSIGVISRGGPGSSTIAVRPCCSHESGRRAVRVLQDRGPARHHRLPRVVVAHH